jgi:hypothetical protein
MGWQALQGGGSAGVAGGGGSGSAVGSGSSSKQKLMSMFGRRASQSNVEAQREEVTCNVQHAACNIGCESICLYHGCNGCIIAKGARHGRATSAPGLASPLPHLHRD